MNAMEINVGMRRLFDHDGLCVKCGHFFGEHRQPRGSDGVGRIICGRCPLKFGRLSGDEGEYSPMPFFIEGPILAPDPCFEQRPLRAIKPRSLPRSPGPQSDGGIKFRGYALTTDAFSQFESGHNVRNDRTYKFVLYCEQEGRCAGCGDWVRYENLEMDRISPGSAGGQYVVGNVQLLCGSCNKIKGNRDMQYLRQHLRNRGALPE